MSIEIEVLDEHGNVVTVIDPDDSCRPYEPNDRCGGCGECLLMQAIHYGYKLREVNVDNDSGTEGKSQSTQG
jgi:hypothetical protein